MARVHLISKNKILLKLSIFSLAIVLFSSLFKVYQQSKTDLIRQSQEISFPGTTYVNINRTIRHLNLTKTTPDHEILAAQNLQAVSSFFSDKNMNLTLVIAATPNKQLYLSVIKNDTLIQNQKINHIDEKMIHLQYGQIELNAQGELMAEAQATDIF